jgi:hypothetical protein
MEMHQLQNVTLDGSKDVMYERRSLDFPDPEDAQNKFLQHQ